MIGAGAAGLVAAREMHREGHSVTVFEQGQQVGGVWVLDDNVEDDPLGTKEGRRAVHSSMYDALRVNLPRELMGFSDFPFVPEVMQARACAFAVTENGRAPFCFAMCAMLDMHNARP